ncbi:MAG TPA: AraC family transcriptional regulator [Clostridia bacterium]|nr:AraC family transcriptional regulator [Clostridia bacterium]
MINEYQQKIDKVKAYIEDNLTDKLDLEKLAGISNFSKYHFSRVFAAIEGITPIEFLTKRRMERSAEYLKTTGKTVVEIASLCGFDTLSSFNAAFRKYFGKTPRELRKEFSNNPSASRNNEEENTSSFYYDVSKNYFLRRIWDMNITLEELPDMEVAYARKVGSYLDSRGAWDKILKWSYENWINPANTSYIGVSLDDPADVPEEECRFDACVTIPEGFNKQEDPDVKFRTLKGGLYALYRFHDTVDKLAIAYSSIFGQWLPNSDYDLDDRDCLEFNLNDPAKDPEGKSIINLYIPVRKRQ